MKNQATATLPYDQIGRRIATRLSAANAEIEHDILERLRVARQQAVAQRKIASTVVASGVAMSSGGAAALHFHDAERPGLWSRVAAALPLLALVAGLLAIYVTQNDNRADEVAEIDAALLTDDLPPAAYADQGFMQFLKHDGPSTQP
ncbi:DUF3619 family protein [Pseudorhodoferax sp. Leaf267]|uniref:DUF3619 family protein n=1 Tax=Pseudorhodoferax sp. Leaf267 TaxID=1736316 RepID=UPI0006F8DBA5|nr:DUF3619 family protein [Pseudorhodoferax sp. Leaf267]KQP14920.1 hypothetical protein ASF43_12755 [Pseudorhodoferax sp. Leaf267]